MEIYIEKFHTLGGETLDQHQKNFRLYMKTLDNAASFNTAEFFKKLWPKCHQEEIFRVMLLQKFKQYSELINVLKSGNRILAKVALKDEKFIEEIFKRYSVENKFTKELTPYVSYVTRFNLIKKLARLVNDEVVAGEFYKKVYEKYGLHAARDFLIKCKLEFVMETVEKFELDLSVDELILLHKRSAEMFGIYLRRRSITTFEMKLSTYLIKISWEEFDKFTKHATKIVLGKKFIKKYINEYKERLIVNPDHCPVSIDAKILVKNLTPDEMIRLFENIFRYEQHYVFNYIRYYLNYCRKKYRSYILFTSFRNVHGCELWEKQQGVEISLLELLAFEDRIKFDLIKSHPELLPLPQAISTIKTKINVTSDIWNRGNLCVNLLRACTYNEDYEVELLGILRYYNTHHKNDHETPRSNFLDYLQRNFKLETFGKEYWDVIEEMILLFEVNKEHLNCMPHLLGKFLMYKYSNGIECTETLIKFFKCAPDNITDYSSLVGKYEKDCLLRLPELLPEIYRNEKEIRDAKVNYLNLIFNYNGRHPKDKHINPYNYFEFWKILLRYYKENQYSNNELITYLLETLPKNDVEMQRQIHFSQEIRKMGADRGFSVYFYKWFMRQNPKIISDNPHKFIECIGSTDDYLGYEIQKCTFLGVTQKLEDASLEILGSNSEKKIHAINYLSFHSKSVDFLKFYCKKFLPAEGCKINVKEVDRVVLETQIALLKCLKNGHRPSVLIETLLPFCKGDYFKYCLDPLYFIMYHTTEDRLEKTIFELLKREVSVRKHTVHLTAAVGSIDLKIKVFSMMAKEEKNVSVRKYVLKKILKHFFNEKTETSWELLKNNLSLITVDDNESLDQLKDIYKVPKAFLNNYLVAIWDFFSGFNNKSQFDLIYRFHNILNDVALDDFCRKVIASSLYNLDNISVRDTEIFTAKYLLMGVQNMDERFEFVWDLIQSKAENERDKHRILNTFCEEIKNQNPYTVHRMLITKILTKYPSLNIRKNLLSLELLLNSTAFYVNWNKQHSTLIDFLVEQHDYVMEKYPHVLPFFVDFMADFIQGCFPYPVRKLELLKVITLLLEKHEREKYGLLCFLLLRGDYRECVDLMRNILHLLQFNASPSLKVYLEKYLYEHPEFDDN